MTRYNCAAESLTGSRPEQQDRYVFFEDKGVLFAAVCDGMGGLSEGAAAAAAAVTALSEKFANRKNDNIPAFYLGCIEEINNMVYSMTDRSGRRIRCGTTVVSCAVKEDKLYWLSAGDSRLYICREDKITALTSDHNYYAELDEKLKEGSVTAEEYEREAAKGHALTSFIGMKKLRKICMNVRPFQLGAGDKLILTSDGLYKALSEEEIAACMVGTAEEITEKIRKKIEELKDKTLDNITYIVMSVQHT